MKLIISKIRAKKVQLFFSNRYSVTTDPSFLYYQNTSVFDTQEGHTVTESPVDYLEDELTHYNLRGKSLSIKVNINEDFGSAVVVGHRHSGPTVVRNTYIIDPDDFQFIDQYTGSLCINSNVGTFTHFFTTNVVKGSEEDLLLILRGLKPHTVHIAINNDELLNLMGENIRKAIKEGLIVLPWTIGHTTRES